MSQLIINDIPPYTQATAIAGQVLFGTNWTANVASDVVVYVTPLNIPPNDATQKLQYPADYNVAFVGALQEVQVTLVNPVNAGDVVTITRMTPADRENLYSNTNFLPSMLDNDFGILTLVDQQAELVNQMIAPRYNYSATINPNVGSTTDTILPILGANQIWVMNNTRTAIEAVTFSSGSGTITMIDTGLGLTGGPITTSGTISFAPMNPQTLWVNTANFVAYPTQVPITFFVQSSQIGVTVEAWSPALDSIASLNTVANELIYTTAPNTYGVISPNANSVLVTDNINVPSLKTILPLAVQSNITQLGAQTQALNMNSHLINNVLDPINPQDAATKAYVMSQTTGAFLPLAGGTMTGAINMGNQKIQAMADPSSAQDAVTLNYLQTSQGNYLLKSGGTMTGQINMGSHYITNLLDPVNPQDAATKNYVDLIAAGFTVLSSVYAASTANLTASYNPGASGIGATLTNTGTLATFTIDGTTPPTNSRILVKDQTTLAQNGIYTLTNTGSPTVAWILTRSTDYDQPSEIKPGDLVIVNNGATYAGTSFVETDSVSAVGTDPIQFSQFTFSATSVLLKANNLSDVNNKTIAFNNISPLTTKGDLLGFSTQNVRLPVGLNNGQIFQVNSSAATGLAWSTATYPTITTQNQLLYSSATNTVTGLATSNGAILVTDGTGLPQFLANPAASGKVLQSVSSGSPAWSTPSYPASSGSAGKVIISDGTNNIYSNPTFPNTNPSAGKILIGDGTNWVISTPTYPNASALPRKILVSDGTNFVASAETWAVPGTAGNILTSDGTNWISSPSGSGGGTVNPGTTNQVAYYAVNGNAVSGANLGQGLSFSGNTLLVGGANNIPFNGGQGIQDSIGNNLLTFSNASSAVNYFKIFNANTGIAPLLYTAGSDTNIPFKLSSQGLGYIAIDSNSGSAVVAMFSPQSASAVNYLNFYNGATGNNPGFSAVGSDTNIGIPISTKGTGGIVLLGNSGTVNLAQFLNNASAVNYIGFNNAPTGTPVLINAYGSDTNISMQLISKGTGGVLIKGVTDGSNAPTGYVGEVVTINIPIGSAVSVISGTAKTVTPFNLPPGDWLITGVIHTNPASGTTTSSIVAAINNVTNAFPTTTDPSTPWQSLPGLSTPANNGLVVSTGIGRLSVSATTTIYLIAQVAFAVSTMSVYGYITATRVR